MIRGRQKACSGGQVDWRARRRESFNEEEWQRGAERKEPASKVEMCEGRSRSSSLRSAMSEETEAESKGERRAEGAASRRVRTERSLEREEERV